MRGFEWTHKGQGGKRDAIALRFQFFTFGCAVGQRTSRVSRMAGCRICVHSAFVFLHSDFSYSVFGIHLRLVLTAASSTAAESASTSVALLPSPGPGRLFSFAPLSLKFLAHASISSSRTR